MLQSDNGGQVARVTDRVLYASQRSSWGVAKWYVRGRIAGVEGMSHQVGLGPTRPCWCTLAKGAIISVSPVKDIFGKFARTRIPDFSVDSSPIFLPETSFVDVFPAFNWVRLCLCLGRTSHHSGFWVEYDHLQKERIISLRGFLLFPHLGSNNFRIKSTRIKFVISCYHSHNIC